MVDLVVTAANVQPGSSGITKSGIAGEQITAGDSVFIAADGDVEVCQHDLTALEAACVGVALNDAATGQTITYAVSGDVDMGAILAIGQTYVVGSGPGGIAPEADVGAADFLTVIGVATSANDLKLGILQSGVAHA